MNDLVLTTLANNITTSTITGNGIYYYNPSVIPYCDPYNNYTITTSAWTTKLETDSNELKINIKKHLIKFNFSL